MIKYIYDTIDSTNRSQPQIGKIYYRAITKFYGIQKNMN